MGSLFRICAARRGRRSSSFLGIGSRSTQLLVSLDYTWIRLCWIQTSRIPLFRFSTSQNQIKTWPVHHPPSTSPPNTDTIPTLHGRRKLPTSRLHFKAQVAMYPGRLLPESEAARTGAMALPQCREGMTRGVEGCLVWASNGAVRRVR